MAKSKYESQRTPSEINVINAMNDFTNYVFKITRNNKQFPEKLNHTLVDAFRNKCIEMTENLYDAVLMRIQNRSDLEALNRKISVLRSNLRHLYALLNISYDQAKIKNPEYIGELISNLSNEFKRWTDNARRLGVRNIQKNRKREERKAFQKKMKAAWADMPKNADGFISLKKKGLSYGEIPL